MTNQQKIHTQSAHETHALGKRLAQSVQSGLVCLYGELGAGKTTFVRGLAEGLGITSRVSSPTFTYQRIHKGKIRLYHFDCYRIPQGVHDELIMQEIYDAVRNNDGVVVIEWSEKVAKLLPSDRLDIFFEYGEGNSRIIQMREIKNPRPTG